MPVLESKNAPGVPVRPNIKQKSFNPDSLSYDELQEFFDNCPFEDIRSSLMYPLATRGPSKKVFEWFEERIRAYASIKSEDGYTCWVDFTTTFMLLRSLRYITFADKSFKAREFELIMDVLELTRTSSYSYYADYLKESVVIFCGYLKNNHERYNARARDIIREILARAPRFNTNYGIHRRLILIAGEVGDISLLPAIRSHVLPVHHHTYTEGGLDSMVLKYLTISDEALALDGAARQIVALLEGIERGEVSVSL